MYSEKSPNFENKAVLFHLGNSEYDTAIYSPKFEMQHGRLFVTGPVVEGSSQNDWLSGLTASLAWDHVQGYIIFDSAEDYLSRLTLAWKEGSLQ